MLPIGPSLLELQEGSLQTAQFALVAAPGVAPAPAVETPEERAARIKRERDEALFNMGALGIGVLAGFIAERSR